MALNSFGVGLSMGGLGAISRNGWAGLIKMNDKRWCLRGESEFDADENAVPGANTVF